MYIEIINKSPNPSKDTLLMNYEMNYLDYKGYTITYTKAEATVLFTDREYTFKTLTQAKRFINSL